MMAYGAGGGGGGYNGGAYGGAGVGRIRANFGENIEDYFAENTAKWSEFQTYTPRSVMAADKQIDFSGSKVSTAGRGALEIATTRRGKLRAMSKKEMEQEFRGALEWLHNFLEPLPYDRNGDPIDRRKVQAATAQTYPGVDTQSRNFGMEGISQIFPERRNFGIANAPGMGLDNAEIPKWAPTFAELHKDVQEQFPMQIIHWLRLETNYYMTILPWRLTDALSGAITKMIFPTSILQQIPELGIPRFLEYYMEGQEWSMSRFLPGFRMPLEAAKDPKLGMFIVGEQLKQMGNCIQETAAFMVIDTLLRSNAIQNLRDDKLRSLRDASGEMQIIRTSVERWDICKGKLGFETEDKKIDEEVLEVQGGQGGKLGLWLMPPVVAAFMALQSDFRTDASKVTDRLFLSNTQDGPNAINNWGTGQVFFVRTFAVENVGTRNPLAMVTQRGSHYFMSNVVAGLPNAVEEYTTACTDIMIYNEDDDMYSRISSLACVTDCGIFAKTADGRLISQDPTPGPLPDVLDFSRDADAGRSSMRNPSGNFCDNRGNGYPHLAPLLAGQLQKENRRMTSFLSEFAGTTWKALTKMVRGRIDIGRVQSCIERFANAADQIKTVDTTTPAVDNAGTRYVHSLPNLAAGGNDPRSLLGVDGASSAAIAAGIYTFATATSVLMNAASPPAAVTAAIYTFLQGGVSMWARLGTVVPFVALARRPDMLNADGLTSATSTVSIRAAWMHYVLGLIDRLLLARLAAGNDLDGGGRTVEVAVGGLIGGINGLIAAGTITDVLDQDAGRNAAFPVILQALFPRPVNPRDVASVTAWLGGVAPGAFFAPRVFNLAGDALVASGAIPANTGAAVLRAYNTIGAAVVWGNYSAGGGPLDAASGAEAAALVTAFAAHNQNAGGERGRVVTDEYRAREDLFAYCQFMRMLDAESFELGNLRGELGPHMVPLSPLAIACGTAYVPIGRVNTRDLYGPLIHAFGPDIMTNANQDYPPLPMVFAGHVFGAMGGAAWEQIYGSFGIYTSTNGANGPGIPAAIGPNLGQNSTVPIAYAKVAVNAPGEVADGKAMCHWFGDPRGYANKCRVEVANAGWAQPAPINSNSAAPLSSSWAVDRTITVLDALQNYDQPFVTYYAGTRVARGAMQAWAQTSPPPPGRTTQSHFIFGFGSLMDACTDSRLNPAEAFIVRAMGCLPTRKKTIEKFLTVDMMSPIGFLLSRPHDTRQTYQLIKCQPGTALGETMFKMGQSTTGLDPLAQEVFTAMGFYMQPRIANERLIYHLRNAFVYGYLGGWGIQVIPVPDTPGKDYFPSRGKYASASVTRAGQYPLSMMVLAVPYWYVNNSTVQPVISLMGALGWWSGRSYLRINELTEDDIDPRVTFPTYAYYNARFMWRERIEPGVSVQQLAYAGEEFNTNAVTLSGMTIRFNIKEKAFTPGNGPNVFRGTDHWAAQGEFPGCKARRAAQATFRTDMNPNQYPY